MLQKTPRFAPAGQSTQLIVGATPENDLQIVSLAEGLYQKFHLKRVYYSAYVPVNQNSLFYRPYHPHRRCGGKIGFTRQIGC